MVSKAKLYAKLDTLEAEFLRSLIPHLRNAADGHNDLVFCVTTFNSVRGFKGKTDSVTEELVRIGSQILILKEKLGESCAGTPAERICWYCRKWVTLRDNDRRASQLLAARFLSEIEALNS